MPSARRMSVRHGSGNHSMWRWTSGAEYLRSKAKRKRRAARMRARRIAADRAKRCWQCDRPVATSKRTGKPAKLCRSHLAADWNRKLTYLLPWEVVSRKLHKPMRELIYPLVFEADIP